MQYVFDGKQIRARISQAYIDLLVLAKLGDSKALLTPNPSAG